MLISELIKNKTAKERASLKGLEIAKIKSVPRTNVKFSGADYDIEITEIKAIEGGVELLARAWNPDGTQVGFGDGSIEIERFRIFNPPILVEDPLGDIVVNYSDGSVERQREDLLEATKQILVRIIRTVAKDGSNIVPGKVGNTTSTFIPDPDPESTSVDSNIGTSRAATTWATLRAATDGDTAGPSTAFGAVAGHYGRVGAWQEIYRSIFLFDTSALPDTDTISSASITFRGHSKANDNGNNIQLRIVASTPASNTNIVVGDYDQVGATSFSDTIITYANFADTGDNVYDLNANGIAAITKTGVSKFGTRSNYDLDNTEPSGGSDNQDQLSTKYSDNGANQPLLTVVHGAGATLRSRMLMGIGQ